MVFVESEKMKVESATAPPSEEGEPEDKLPLKAHLGLQAKSAIENKSPVRKLVINQYHVYIIAYAYYFSRYTFQFHDFLRTKCPILPYKQAIIFFIRYQMM